MSDLAAWLEKTLATAEGHARTNTGDSMHTMYCGYDQLEFMRGCGCDGPAMVLRLVAATRALLELHERWELEEYEYTGNCVVTVEDGVTYTHWPAGSITGQRQVGVRYECWHCINSDESHMDWPCPTMKAVAAGWGWVDE